MASRFEDQCADAVAALLASITPEEEAEMKKLKAGIYPMTYEAKEAMRIVHEEAGDLSEHADMILGFWVTAGEWRHDGEV